MGSSLAQSYERSLCKADSDGREWQTHSLNGDDIIDKEGHQAQGSATLEGAKFEVYNRSTYKVEHNNVVYEPGELIETLTTDTNGYTYIDDLPAGVYDCVEVQAPAGYKLHATRKENTTTVTLVDDNGVIKMKDATGAHASVDSN